MLTALLVGGIACAPSGPVPPPAEPVAVQVSSTGERSVTIPRTLMLRGEALAAAKLRLQQGDPLLQPPFDRLLDEARKALDRPLVSVADKSTLLPPSGSRNDYYSLSPYWWPDPSKPDGLPYIRRDGETNPESKRDLDQPRVARLGETLQTLGLAYYLSGDERYAARAAQQLRHWFLDSATAMTPHLHYAQLVRGIDRERGSGIIDTRWFIEAVDAARLIEGSGNWTAADDAALRRWFAQYRDWLVNSPNGIDESDAPNNHGSWYAAQVVSYSLYTGDTAQALRWLGTLPARIDSQITATGDQPVENRRTRSFHYHAFNIEALSRLAEMGRHVGVDVWHLTAVDGAGIRRAVDFFGPFLVQPDRWPHQQINALELDEMTIHLRRAYTVYRDPAYLRLLAQLPANVTRTDVSALLYPDSVPAQ